MKSNVLIIGGGIVGLATAYNIALQSDCDVTIIEQGYVGSGASTRNAAHFRVHFWAPENVQFAIESKRRLMDFASEIGRGSEIQCGGYLWLLYEQEQINAYRRTNDKSWSEFGVPGKFLTPEELSEEYPYLNVDGVIAGFLGPQDGKMNPNTIVLGYYRRDKELGVRFLNYTSGARPFTIG